MLLSERSGRVRERNHATCGGISPTRGLPSSARRPRPGDGVNVHVLTNSGTADSASSLELDRLTSLFEARCRRAVVHASRRWCVVGLRGLFSL